MSEEKLRFVDYRDGFYDEFGNKTNNYIVEKYCKSCDNTWHLEETIKTHVGSYFVVNGKPYFECNGSLLSLNTNFESENCGACYRVVGEDTTEYVRIVGNEYLCKNECLGLRLHRQDYSDGTCFFTLLDHRGQFRVDYGNRDISELIKVLERGIEIDKKYIGILPSIEETIQQTRKLIENMKKYIPHQPL